MEFVEALDVPASGPATGAWRTLASLPKRRAFLALVPAPNHGLYALGGTSDPGTNPSQKSERDVFEYDPSADTWSNGQVGQPGQVPTFRAGLPTPRFGLGAAVIGNRVYALGGTIDATTMNTFEDAVYSTLPSASAGGPYTVPAGGTVGLSASGSDPEGGAINFAWDLNGDLLYETPGQNPSFSAAGVAPGVHTIRVRASDPDGAYGLASTTVTVTTPSKIVFVTQPGGAQAGSPLSPQPVVQIQDANGALVPAFNGPVTISFGTNAGAGILGGTATVTAVNGVATFTDLFVNAAGSGYTLVASANNLQSATSAPFTITAPQETAPTATPTSVPTAIPTPVPTFCNPRPNVGVAAAPTAPGQLLATIASQILPATPSNGLQRITITHIDNATVSLNGAVLGSGQVVPLAGGTTQVALLVQRQTLGVASHVAFVVTDICGDWPSFVGGGPAAF